MIHFVIGTRAQLIKTAPLMCECSKRKLPYNFIFLAQHKNTIREMIGMFRIKEPDLVLGDYRSDITSTAVMLRWVTEVLCRGLVSLRRLFHGDKNGVVVVHGDALPVLIGGFLARAAGLKVAHVEAGLRSFNYGHPFPEELIRVLTWKLGLVDHYFCPNEWALKNVAVYRGDKHNTKMNTLVDALRMALQTTSSGDGSLAITESPYAIATLHRFETIASKETLRRAFDVLRTVAEDRDVVFILHPPTERAMLTHGLDGMLRSHPRIHLRPRLKYFDFIRLLKGSDFLISDGGSNQEECFYMGHPCLLLRNATERMEGLGENVVLSRFEDETINSFLADPRRFKRYDVEIDFSPSEYIIRALDGYA